MKLFVQILLLTYIGLISTGCWGQSNTNQNDILFQKPMHDAPLEIPKIIKKQDSIAKQIYILQRELRDLRIKQFVDNVKQNCEIAGNIKIEFYLDQKSGEFIKYLVDSNEVEN